MVLLAAQLDSLQQDLPRFLALPLWVVLRLAARGAPTRPALTGTLAGLVVGSGAAAGYSFFCLQDNPLFYVTWYGTAIALTMIAGAWLGARRLRW